MDKAPSDPLADFPKDGTGLIGTRFKDDEKGLGEAIAAAEKADAITKGAGSTEAPSGKASLFDTQSDTQAEAEKLALGK